LPEKIGLSGEIRAVNRIEQRIAEAEKLGFQKILVSKYNQKGLKNQKFNIEVISMGRWMKCINIILNGNGLVLRFNLCLLKPNLYENVKEAIDSFAHIFFPHLCVAAEVI